MCPAFPCPTPGGSLGKVLGALGSSLASRKWSNSTTVLPKEIKTTSSASCCPVADLGDAEGARIDAPLLGVQLLLLEERVGQHVAVEPVALDGQLSSQYVDVELEGFGHIVNGDADVLHTLQIAPQSRPRRLL